jgi:hypothetical protein
MDVTQVARTVASSLFDLIRLSGRRISQSFGKLFKVLSRLVVQLAQLAGLCETPEDQDAQVEHNNELPSARGAT